jgi:hypothetical protein
MRRFRPTTAFGSISGRERRNADRFFADLMGAASRSSLAPESLSELPPAHEAETLTGSEDVPAGALAPPARPAPTVTRGRDDDEIIVTRADGTKFHLRRRVRAKVFTQPGRPRVGLCSDDERVFFRLCWCEGTQGTIDFGANPQGAFKDLMEKVFDQISKGADPEKIKETFENATIQTFLKIDVAKRDNWLITGDITLNINRTGITSATARVTADTGWLKLGVEGSVGADGKKVLVTVTIPLGDRKPKGKPCPVRELMVWWDVECLREVPVTITIQPPIPFIDKNERLFLYFDYMKDTLRRDPAGTAATPGEEVEAILRSDPTIGTARLNKRALERLDYLVSQGYFLTSVNGYTSPEGLRRTAGAAARLRGTAAPTCAQMLSDPRAPKWEGNDKLSCERAEKVRKVIVERYRPGLGMRATPPVMRFPAGERMPDAVGRSETPALDDRLGRELEGDALRRVIIQGDPARSVRPFLDANPDERARMTAEDQAFVADTRNSIRSRAERVFENLRRVEINLKGREMLKPGTLVTTNLEHVHSCPDDLVEAAERQWGSRIPFVRRDPPVCSAQSCIPAPR